MRWSRRASPPPEWVTRWGAPSLVLLVAFGLRLFRLGDANLWWDEALAVWGVRKGLLSVTLWTAGDVHPPLYFWSLWAWVQFAGESEFAMRALSVAFGLLTVAVVYSLGTLIAGRTTGSLAALFTGLSRFHIWWSQEMRMYVLAGLAGTLSLYLFMRWLRTQSSDAQSDTRSKSPSPPLLLTLCVLATICALYTIYLMASLVLVENVIILTVLARPRGYRRRGLLRRWVAAQFAIVVAFGGWLLVSWGRMRTWSVSEPFDPVLLVRLYVTLLTTGISVNVHRYTGAAFFPMAVLLLGAGLIAGEWLRSRQSRRSEPLEALTLLLNLMLPGLAIYLASVPRGLFYVPKVEARYFLPFAPAFWVLLAWSVVVVGRKWRTAAWVCGCSLVALSLVLLPGYYGGRHLRDELQTMVRAIVSQAEGGDVVLLDSGGRYPLFLYYYEGFSDDLWRPPVVKIPPDEGDLKAEDVDQILQPIADSHRRIWLAEVDVNLTDPARLVERWLGERFTKVLALRYGHNMLHLLDSEALPPVLATSGYEPQHRVDAPVGTGGYLTGWELPVKTFVPGDVTHVSLLWERLPRETVALALRNRSGQILLEQRAESSQGPEARRQQFDFPIYAATPEGIYDVVLSPAPASGAVLGTLRIVGTRPLPRAGAPQVLLGARLGQGITLVGYTLNATAGEDLDQVKPNDNLILDLYWRVDRKLEEDYTVFVHLLGEAYNPKTQGPVWGQHDSQPANSGYVTTQWLVGDVIVDRHTMQVDAEAPPGPYRVEVGMYTVQDGQRLAVISSDGQLLGDRVLLDMQVFVSQP